MFSLKAPFCPTTGSTPGGTSRPRWSFRLLRGKPSSVPAARARAMVRSKGFRCPSLTVEARGRECLVSRSLCARRTAGSFWCSLRLVEDDKVPGIMLSMLRLQEDTLIVFVSDSHIGGDPGCDGFESPEELEALFEELVRHEGPVELILAGDFFDFLQISPPRSGVDRATLTMSRPEYVDMFAALERFKSGDQKRVVYLPGNHDAEMWWNPKIQETLRERGLVDEFALSYLASFEVGGERRIIYCEHGNQFDPANTVDNYADPLDTPLGYHVVTDFTRRIAPFGEISRDLDLSEIKNVYPLVAIPQWIASRYFYGFAGKVAAYLLLPLLVAYAVYRAIAFFLA